MTTLKHPYAHEDQIKTEELIKIGKRLAEIATEISDITLMYAVHSEYNVFSESIKEMQDNIIETLGRRQLDNKDAQRLRS